MKAILTLILITLTFGIKAQIKLVISDTNKVEYTSKYATEGIDSVVYIKSEEYNVAYDYCGSYEVYFDKELRQLAYKSETIADSCITYDFWRNGKLKAKTIYYLNYYDFKDTPVDWYYERYCSNGQLIYKGPSPNKIHDGYLAISYHCNGNKKLEMYQLGVCAEGKLTEWYENGKVKKEEYYNKCLKIGEWKYWTVDGQLDKTELYENDKLIETKNYR